MKRLVTVLVGGVVFALLVVVFTQVRQRAPAPASSAPVAVPPTTTSLQPSLPPSPTALSGKQEDVQVVATGLEVPWAIAFAPDGTLYATERAGRLVRIRNGAAELVARVPDVTQQSESGLLGLALDPAFATNRFLYLYHTFLTREKGLTNRVVRYRLTDKDIVDRRVLLGDIPAAPFHDGGRISFGPDGHLYIATGDATKPDRAQQRDSLAGKILRIRADGSIPADNPFPGSPVYSLGHRNVQGLAWAADGALYATEHGPSGPPPDCCHDEVNRIVAGGNGGWPVFMGNVQRTPGPRADISRGVFPLVESGPSETWAPAGDAVVGSILYFGGLKGQALFAVDLENPTSVRKLFQGQFGRIRDVVRGPDGALYLTTSNRDGRGTPQPSDDQIIRIVPEALR